MESMLRKPLANLNKSMSKLPVMNAKETSVLKRKNEEPEPRGTKAKTEEAPMPAKTLSKSKSTTNLQRQPSMPAKKPTAAPPAPTSDAPSDGAQKKRAAWDLKGRLEDLEKSALRQKQDAKKVFAQNAELSETMAEYTRRIEQLEEIRANLQTDIQSKETESTQVHQRVDELETQLRRDKMAFEEEILTLKRTYNREVEDLTRRNGVLSQDLSCSQTECTALRSHVTRMTAEGMESAAMFATTRTKLESALSTIAAHEATIAQLRERVAILEHGAHAAEEHRKMLHETIQQLKGNIRVFCRVRPATSADFVPKGKDQSMNASLTAENIFSFADPEMRQMTVYTPESSLTSTSKTSLKANDFSFDKIFGPESTQEDVFGEIAQLVQSALDGYNVCIFAYGQTGSGKTFTMEGNHGHAHSMGIIPRAVRQVFAHAEELKGKGWVYSFTASYIEIYNETLRDLLGEKDAEVKLETRKVRGVDEVHVGGAVVIPVEATSQVHDLLEHAHKRRAVAKTMMNEHSSRSHSVFTLTLQGSNTVTGSTCQARLNLIDLAGSERLSKSEAEGDRRKETTNINKSLSTLSNVILALNNKDKHVPFRDSKLTHLLQTSLVGNSKSLMFVNVSPSPDSVQETMCSLRFATKVNECNIGTARKVK